MISLIKFLKIVLPVATVATATVATVSLVSFRKTDLDKNRENEDKVLDALELTAEGFKEKTILYSKDGKGDSITLEDEDLKQKLLQKLKNGEEYGDLEGEIPDIEKVKKFLSENRDSLINKPSESGKEINSRDIEHSDKPQQEDLPKSDDSEVLDPQGDQDDPNVPNNQQGKTDAEINKPKGQEEDGESQGQKAVEDDFNLQDASLAQGDEPSKNEDVDGQIGEGENSDKQESTSQQSEPKSLISDTKENGDLDGGELSSETDQTESDLGKGNEKGQNLEQKGNSDDSSNSLPKGGETGGEEVTDVQEPSASVSGESSLANNTGTSDGLDPNSGAPNVDGISEETLRELQKLGEQLQSSSSQLEEILLLLKV